MRRQWKLSDKDDFLAWYDATVEIAGRYAMRLAGADRAEDLVQDAYLAVLRRAGSDQLTADGAGLIVTAIRNRFIDGVRAQQVHARRFLLIQGEAESDAQLDSGDDPLEGLTDRDRAVLVMRYVDGASVPEVAAELGISVHAAESVVSRAKARARNRRQAHG
jgi:RNA polymerase sigma-70 factor (ECF subfamily)